MPSSAHEAVLEVFRARPELVAEVLANTLGVALPAFTAVGLEPNDATDLVPTEYRADAVVALRDAAGPVCLVVVEVQLRADSAKPWSWPVYLATVRARHRCPALLLVVCVDRGTAAWAARPIPLGNPGSVLVPLVLGPEQVPSDPGILRHAPELAVLAALAHGRARPDVLDVLVEALASLRAEQAVTYLGLVLAALPQAARTHLEALMTAKTIAYQSEFTERLRAEGAVRAKVESVLRVLEIRGIDPPDQFRSRVTACTDLAQLDTWHERAVTADSIDDLDH